eukprot:TRINITY_DN5239_c0_g1_i1.p1 TRINITY_DN5239_c0_g1~~TRINITY_DN5239_c0_g1_i1.p1  ORF type:complete len:430 (-),score=91.04 TRINITY_DN5239_c0_g1_i1:169-1269(-)
MTADARADVGAARSPSDVKEGAPFSGTFAEGGAASQALEQGFDDVFCAQLRKQPGADLGLNVFCCPSGSSWLQNGRRSRLFVCRIFKAGAVAAWNLKSDGAHTIEWGDCIFKVNDAVDEEAMLEELGTKDVLSLRIQKAARSRCGRATWPSVASLAAQEAELSAASVSRLPSGPDKDAAPEAAVLAASGWGTGADGTLESARSALEAKRMSFKVSVKKTPGTTLGIDVTYCSSESSTIPYGKGIFVIGISEGGLVAEWNAKQGRKHQVRPGDYIYRVNDCFGDTASLIDRLKDQDDLSLYIVQPPTSPGQAVGQLVRGLDDEAFVALAAMMLRERPHLCERVLGADGSTSALAVGDKGDLVAGKGA